MMTKSNFNALTWTILIQLPLYFGLVGYLIIDTINNDNAIISTQKIFLLILLFLSLAFLVFTFGLFAKKINMVYIDGQKHEISFKNILTRKVITFSFDELSGYYKSNRNVGKYGTRTKILLFVKSNKLVGKISSMFYANFSELEIAITNLTFLGQLNYTDIKSIKINFGKNIID